MQEGYSDYRQPEIQIQVLIVIVLIETVSECGVDDEKGKYVSPEEDESG